MCIDVRTYMIYIIIIRTCTVYTFLIHVRNYLCVGTILVNTVCDQVAALNTFSPSCEVVAAQDHRVNTTRAIQHKRATLRCRYRVALIHIYVVSCLDPTPLLYMYMRRNMYSGTPHKGHLSNKDTLKGSILRT